MNRRSFIKRAAAVSAAIAVAPLSLKAARQGVAAITQATGTGRMRLTFKPHELQLRHAFNLARNSRTTTPDVLVRIDLDGYTGFGEASMPPYLGESTESVMRFLSQVDLSTFTDPFQLDDIHDYLDRIAPGNMAAKASVDIALHDLIGKIAGQPLYKLWGLNPDRAPLTSFTIGMDTPEVISQKVDEAAPYKVLKVKMGLDNDRELVQVIRSKTSVPICVDANQGWNDREKALDMCHWLAEQGCLFVEQPFDKKNLTDTAWLRERSPLPVIADEFVQRLDDVRRAADAYDGINIKLMKCGGLHEARQMATVARALGLKVMLGCMTETSCAVSAAAQMASMCHWADLDGNLLITNDPFDGVKIVEGKVTVPKNRPGIGVVEI